MNICCVLECWSFCAKTDSCTCILTNNPYACFQGNNIAIAEFSICQCFHHVLLCITLTWRVYSHCHISNGFVCMYYSGQNKDSAKGDMGKFKGLNDIFTQIHMRKHELFKLLKLKILASGIKREFKKRLLFKRLGLLQRLGLLLLGKYSSSILASYK